MNIAARVGVVINPIAGRTGRRRGESERRRSMVMSAAAAAGVEARVHLTSAAGEARELARMLAEDDCSVVMAMGGDGTVNEVAQGLIGSGVPLGLLPSGSGDGLARGLGIPADPRRAFDVALSGATIRMDVGYANDRLFLNVAGVGFDAAVSREFAIAGRRGLVGYVRKTLGLVRHYRALRYDFEHDEAVSSSDCFLMAVANAPAYGNGAVPAPDADVTDGVFDVLMIQAGSSAQQVWRSRRLFWRRRAAADGVSRLRAKRVEVRAPEILFHLDGDVQPVVDHLTIEIAPGALAVRVPLRFHTGFHM
jgi:YegS/Rv2252/BmrU family lipid kinase